MHDDFRRALGETDPVLQQLLVRHERREMSSLKLIASENFASPAVLATVASILMNKYAEGYPGKRYYEGNEVVDEIENLAIDRAKSLFAAVSANVQAHSGSNANHAVYQALLKPGDAVMGMPVPDGGHLTHGWKVNFSGRSYRQVPYGPEPGTGVVDMDRAREIALEHRPRLIWMGGTSYPRTPDYEEFAEIAREIDAFLVADMAHVSGLIAGGAHPNPLEFAHVLTSTTHKLLRGPRGAVILTSDVALPERVRGAEKPFRLARKLDRAVFPNLQGGPHLHAIAGMAVAFEEAATEDYRQYAHQVVGNAKSLGKALEGYGYTLVSGGTDTHLLVVDFRDSPHTGKKIAQRLSRAGITCNFNMVPGDLRPPSQSSGLRLGTPAVTTLGMKEPEMQWIAELFDRVYRNLDDDDVLESVRAQVADHAAAFPIPGLVWN